MIGVHQQSRSSTFKGCMTGYLIFQMNMVGTVLSHSLSQILNASNKRYSCGTDFPWMIFTLHSRTYHFYGKGCGATLVQLAEQLYHNAVQQGNSPFKRQPLKSSPWNCSYKDLSPLPCFASTMKCKGNQGRLLWLEYWALSSWGQIFVFLILFKA